MAGYERIYWEDEPSTNTPLSAENLNRMDLGIANCASEGAELTEQMETTNARIDEIVALPDGSTTADAELVDIRVGAGGNTYNSAGTAVRTQIKKLASVSDTQPSDPSNRIWIKGDAEEVEIPTMVELNEVKADLTVLEYEAYVSPSCLDSDAENVSLDVSDENGNVLMRLSDGHVLTKEFDSRSLIGAENLPYMPVMKPSTSETEFGISDEHGNVVMQLKDGNVKTKNFDSRAITPRIVTVKKDGSGDYTKIRDAVDSITDANSATNPYVIEIYPGTYNVFDDYTQAEIETAGTESYIEDGSGFVGILLTDGISMRGIGNRDEIILVGELDTSTYASAMRNNISTLNLKDTLSLENLTVIARNIRYCVHDDFPQTLLYAERIVNNCVFRIYNPTSGTEGKTWGEGSRQGKSTFISDCDFGTCFLWHSANLAAATRSSSLTLKNCIALMANISNYNHSVINNVHLFNNAFSFISFGFSNVSSNDYMMTVDGTGFDSLISAPVDWNYITGDMTRFRSNGTVTYQVGQLVSPSGSPYWASGPLVNCTDANAAYGVVVGYDSEWVYVQKSGYLESARFGFSGLSIGDKITIDSDGVLEANGPGDVYGVVTYVSSNGDSFFKMVA